MKYSFKNGPDHPVTELELTNFQLLIREQGRERVIPYPDITDVNLECKGNSFYMTVQSLDFGSLRISNRSFNESGTWDNQSRQYHTFVRVLHMHLLKAHCQAEFCSGFKPSHMLTKFSLLFLLSALLYFFADYTRILPINPLVAGSVLLILGTAFLLLPYVKNPPKHYKPSDIPLNLLPPAN
ncbi:MAG: hypothetical protein WAZ98_09705 [Cyclobacteriaceae bacterium]